MQTRRWLHGGRALPCVFGVAIVGLLTLLCGAATAQPSLQPLAANVIAFASDGTRYVAWEARPPGVSGRVPIVLLDTRTGRRLQIEPRCGLFDRAPATAGRFLLDCGQQEAALLEVRKGAIAPLPKPTPNPAGVYGPIWKGVGLRYVIGQGGLHSRCHRAKRHESCTALYDIATGATTLIPESRVPDPDRPGAPPLCRGLRSAVLSRSRFEDEEGNGPLAPLGSDSSYSDGLFAVPEQIGEAPVTHIRIDRCSGRSLRLHTPPEPESLELSGGILTWDTGHPTNAFEEELEGSVKPGALRHGELRAFNIATRKGDSRTLPPLPFGVTGRSEPKRVIGAFGYSAHTDYGVFWLAARTSRSDDQIVGCFPGTETFSVYAARF